MDCEWWRLRRPFSNLVEWRKRRVTCRQLISDIKHSWKSKMFVHVCCYGFSRRWESLYNTAVVYMVNKSFICACVCVCQSRRDVSPPQDRSLVSHNSFQIDWFIYFVIQGDKVLIVISGDNNYKDTDEEDRSVISRWARRKVASQFKGEYLDGLLSSKQNKREVRIPAEPRPRPQLQPKPQLEWIPQEV